MSDRCRGERDDEIVVGDIIVRLRPRFADWRALRNEMSLGPSIKRNKTIVG
jgi:hypothetical protein